MSAETELIPESLHQTLGYQCLLEMYQQGIRYCIWKSIDRFEEGVNGETDLDLLAAPEEERKVVEFLTSRGWIQLDSEPWRAFPGVLDFVKYDPRVSRLIHIHFHFHLIMGEPRLKSLVLPFTDKYLGNHRVVGGLPCATPELELVVFIIRVAVKVGWRNHIEAIFPFLKGYFLRKFHSEFNLLKNQTSLDSFISVVSQFDFVTTEDMRLIFEDLNCYDAKLRQKVWDSVEEYYRFSKSERIRQRIYKWFQRRIVGTGKTLTTGGRSVAFCGADGSGKTTMIDQLIPILKSHIKVKRVYMGGSPNSRQLPRMLLRLFVFPVFAVVRRIVDETTEGKLKRYYYGFEDYLITTEKLKRYRKAKRALARNELVVFERFPIFAGYGDREPLESLFEKILPQRFEEIERPELIFLFDISAEESLKRKDYHDHDELLRKTTEFHKWAEKNGSSSGVKVIDASLPFEQNKEIVLEKLFATMKG